MKRMVRGGILIAVVCTLVAGYAEVYAWSGSSRGREADFSRHQRSDGFDRHGARPVWFSFDFLFGRPHIGAVIKTIPQGYQTVIAGGNVYYVYDTVYYTACSQGYTVVAQPEIRPAPIVIAQSGEALQQNSPDSVTVYVPNTNGSFASVLLVRRGNGYVGPQGEYYPGNPSVEQLRVLYGR